ncbi:hypothetical protein CUJ83_09675 [Methanocella sp. CWC-04]|uniref:Uncharacterized protein n=1 Tax=Methanooceanicella nereidis TaxID=2052831 RepID=A0AAP2RDT9_9EURY|nr:hypothetical protein [Methanocella sp. CWC-04]
MAADVTIPINKEVTLNKTMKLNIVQVTITDLSMTGKYTEDPENSKWPKLVYNYENIGQIASTGWFEMAFIDENGKRYRAEDITMDLIGPGKTSSERFVEVAVPGDIKVTGFVIYKGVSDTVLAEFEIPYGSQVTPTPAAEPNNKSICPSLLILPLLVVGSIFMARSKK